MLEKLADYDFWGAMTDIRKWKIEITCYINDAQTSEGFKLTIPHAQILTTSPGEANGFIRNEHTFRALRNVQGSTAAEKEQDYTLELWGVDID